MDPPDEPTSGLYERATNGDDGALEQLLTAYLPRLRAFVRSRMSPELRRRESSSDVVQSVCKELVARRDRFEFRSETEFRGWLFTSARNKIVEKLRYHKMAKRDVAREASGAGNESVDGGPRPAEARPTTPSKGAIAGELLERFEAVFDRLPESHREVVALAKFARLPHAEIAERMGRSVGAVRQLLGRALLALSTELDVEL